MWINIGDNADVKTNNIQWKPYSNGFVFVVVSSVAIRRVQTRTNSFCCVLIVQWSFKYVLKGVFLAVLLTPYTHFPVTAETKPKKTKSFFREKEEKKNRSPFRWLDSYSETTLIIKVFFLLLCKLNII